MPENSLPREPGPCEIRWDSECGNMQDSSDHALIFISTSGTMDACMRIDKSDTEPGAAGS